MSGCSAQSIGSVAARTSATKVTLSLALTSVVAAAILFFLERADAQATEPAADEP